MAGEDLSTNEARKDYLKSVLRKQPKKRVETHYGIRDIYSHYKESVVEGLQKSYSVFASVLRDANITIVNELLLAQEIKFPNTLGYFRIKKSKMSFKDTNTLKINWKLTKETGHKVYHTNDHRNNYKYKFYWHKQRLVGVRPYSFIPSRGNKRALAKILLTNLDQDYFE